MSAPLRIAVVGCGYWGAKLVRTFAAAPDVELAAVCDLDPDRLAVARGFRVGRSTTRAADVLDDAAVDAVALATPVATHRALGEAVLRAGKHLWIEKPLAGSVEDAEALVTAARALDRRLLVDHTFVYSPAVREIRALLARGDLGDVMYVESTRANLGRYQPDAGVVWDLGAHDLAIAQYILGRRPTEISAIAARHLGEEQEDVAYVTLRYGGQRLVTHFHLSWLSPVKIRRVTMAGTRRMLVYDDLARGGKLKIHDVGADAGRPGAPISYRRGGSWSPRIESAEALALAAADLVAAVRERRPPVSDGRLGLDVVQALAAAQQSIEKDGVFVGVSDPPAAP